MPDFFLISGLFLARVIDRDWRTYLDRKVVHFAYFYVLWVTIQFAFKAPVFAAERRLAGAGSAYLQAFVRAVRHAVVHLPAADLLRRRPSSRATRSPLVAIWLAAAALEIAPIDTGSTVIDEFAGALRLLLHRLHLAPRIFALRAATCRRALRRRSPASCCGRVVNDVLVQRGYADLPFVSLALGLVGAGAVVTVSALLARSTVRPAALLRRELARHLSRVLPADGGEPHRPAQDRPRSSTSARSR